MIDLNKERTKRVIIFCLQSTWNEFKQIAKKDIESSGYDNDGTFYTLAGWRERAMRRNELLDTIRKLTIELKELNENNI